LDSQLPLFAKNAFNSPIKKLGDATAMCEYDRTMNYKTKVTQEDLINRQRDLYRIFLKKVPSKKMLRLEMEREDSGLQDFVCNNLKPTYEYATGIHTIELIEAMAASQIENGLEELEGIHTEACASWKNY
jgi:flagellar motor component MotA